MRAWRRLGSGLPQVATAATAIAAIGALVFTGLSLQATQEGQYTDRYTKAVEQLGSQQIDVRLGAIYALERLAKDSTRDSPTIAQVLTAFVRNQTPELKDCPIPQSAPDGVWQQLRTDISAAITVRQRLRTAGTSPEGIDLSLRCFAGVDLSMLDLTEANLSSANLRRAALAGANLAGANLISADLSEARLDSARLNNARLGGARMVATVLVAADLTGAYLTGANLTGAHLYRANLTNASLVNANLTEARLKDADLTGADLYSARLTGATGLK